MTPASDIGKLDTEAALAAHLDALVIRDPRLAPIRGSVETVGLRLRAPGFAGLAHIVCGQQLSVASANAIWMRLDALPRALDPEGFLAADLSTLRQTGLSQGKVTTLRAAAEAVLDGRLDFARLETLPADEAIAMLTALRGIGPWTAEVYLLFCAAHPDIFPTGDLALQKAVGHGLGLAERPSAKELAGLAADWAPHRGAAALLFWRYFATLARREGVLV